ncbi:MAG: alkaline phosphatase family protein [Phycisphaerae bacterium]
MATRQLIFLSIPGLRPGDVDAATTPTLFQWAERGTIAELTPTFPCVTSPVQANMLTGCGPSEHGVIANGFYYRERNEVGFWVAHNEIIQRPQTWDVLNRNAPELTSAVWHAQNIKSAGAAFIVTPSPIHEDDGSTKLWCYSKPDRFYQALIERFGHFPLQHYWGPLSNIGSTRWILKAAAHLAGQHAPNFHWIYLPHLDYASQKYGPNSPQARQAFIDLDAELAGFAAAVAASDDGGEPVFLVAGEYAMTDVSGVVYPNRLLREGGFLAIREESGREYVDLTASRAFAMVDHQFAHVYVRNAADVPACAALLRTDSGLAGVFAGAQRKEIGLDHPRSGEIVLVAKDTHWLAYYWWLDDKLAPPFARTVDIHAKPGYDPVELFIDQATKSIPLDATLVKGSHGAPATEPRHRAALICSEAADLVESGTTYRDLDVHAMVLGLLGADR